VQKAGHTQLPITGKQSFDTIRAMISIDVCDGTKTHGNLTMDSIGGFLEETQKKVKTTARNILWVDINAPVDSDWAALAEQFHFHPLALEDAQKQNQRPKLDVYEGYLFLSVHALSNLLTIETQELDLFLGPNYLITIHNEANGPIGETRRRLQQNPESLRNEPGYLLYLLLDALVDEYFPAMDALDAEIDALEMQLYESTEAPDFKPAVALKKKLLLLRQAVSPLRDILNQILRIDDAALISPKLSVFYQDVYDHTLRLTEQIDLHRDLLGGVMDMMMSQTSNRLNHVMKTMTSLSTILMSVALVAGIYGMNFKKMPELDWPLGYFFSLGLMAAVAVSLTIYFKKIKWF
jgi:magnesium transporter